jgi:hypothetical protein
MKLRNGFVSNSSSSSFIICKDKLTATQLCAIENHFMMAKRFGMYCQPGDAWSIDEDEFTIRGSTGMNNFSMMDFFEHIGVNEDDVRWQGEY